MKYPAVLCPGHLKPIFAELLAGTLPLIPVMGDTTQLYLCHNLQDMAHAAVEKGASSAPYLQAQTFIADSLGVWLAYGSWLRNCDAEFSRLYDEPDKAAATRYENAGRIKWLQNLSA